MTDLSAIFKPASLDDETRRSIDAVKLLPGGASFICELHLIECSTVELDRHHRVPEECGGPTNVENMLYACSGCHQFMHRIAIQLGSSKAKKLSPLEATTLYAKRMNLERYREVINNIIACAQLVAAYRTQKNDHAIAPPDIATAAAEIPKEFQALFKQISKEIKRGDGRPIGMANLLALAELEIVAKHRPELRSKIDQHIRSRILFVDGVRKPTFKTNVDDDFDEVQL